MAAPRGDHGAREASRRAAAPALPARGPWRAGQPHRPRPLPQLSQSHQCIGAALGLHSQSAPRVTQSGALCTRFKGREKLAAPEPSQSGEGRGRLGLLPNGRPGRWCRAGGGRVAAASSSKRARLAASLGSPDQWARAVGGAGCPCPGSGLGAGQEPGRAGSVCSAARKCTRMPPLSVSSAGAGPGPAARPAARPKEPPVWGWLLLPLTREAWPSAPPRLPMPGKGSGPRVRDRRGAGRCVRAWRCGSRGSAGAPRFSARSPGGRGRSGRGQQHRRGSGALGGCDAVCPSQLVSG